VAKADTAAPLAGAVNDTSGGTDAIGGAGVHDLHSVMVAHVE